MKASATRNPSFPRATGRIRGSSLIEMVMVVVILSIALVATVSVIANSTRRSADPLVQHRATLLAQAYMDEILSKPFSDDTPVGGLPASTSASVCTTGAEASETRTNFDDVDDYDLVNDLPPNNQLGTALLDYAEYRVQISVTCAGLALGFSDNHDAKLVSIVVTPPVGSEIVFAAYRGNY